MQSSGRSKTAGITCFIFTAIVWVIVLATLLGPLGVWLGFWDFRQGVIPLRKTHNWLIWFVLALTVMTVLAFFVFKIKGRILVFALTAILAGSITWYIPETFKPPKGVRYPPIHDITTDTNNPVAFEKILPLRKDARNDVEYGSGRSMTPDKLARLQTEAYPDIKPQIYDATPDQVFDWAIQAAKELGWELVSVERQRGRIEATDTTFWFRFKDDVVIAISQQKGQTVLNARSLSRVGQGDAGTNANRLRSLFKAIDEQAGK